MKNLIQIATVLFLLIQTIGFSQTKSTVTKAIEKETILKKDIKKNEIDTKNFEDFIGKYELVEADFELEIVEEGGEMYIISPFSKDILIQKNETTLTEPTRGVDLERILDNNNALKFAQNGYETTIKRVALATQN
jgi:hypothetical protein